MEKSIKTQLMDFVTTLPNKIVTRKQIVRYYAAITGRNPETASLGMALTRPRTFPGATDGYLRRSSKKEPRHLEKIVRATFKLVN